jgi:SsrA-binding protein
MTRLSNKKAFFNYEILDKLVAGIVLSGAEVKSIRAGRGSLVGAYVSINNGEVYIKNFQIPHWEFSQEKLDPIRDRKLLLKKREIRRIEKKLEEQGLTMVPLALFFQRGYAKVEIAVARGKKKYDKRHAIKQRDVERRLKGKMRK